MTNLKKSEIEPRERLVLSQLYESMRGRGERPEKPLFREKREMRRLIASFEGNMEKGVKSEEKTKI